MSIDPISIDRAARPSLDGRVAIVTGSGQGIGRVFAKALAKAGAAVAILERNAPGADRVASEIAQDGGQAVAIETDVSEERAVSAAVEHTVSRFGSADILVNNAAIFSTLEMRPFDRIPPQEWERVLRVNVTGPFLCACAVLPYMRKRGHGRIINIASGAVTLGRPNYLHYIASKGALEGMTRSMARELGADGITVNAILPGATFTEIARKTVTAEQKRAIVAMQCVPRPQVPEDLVGALLFLAGDSSSFMTGQALTIDGGATHR